MDKLRTKDGRRKMVQQDMMGMMDMLHVLHKKGMQGIAGIPHTSSLAGRWAWDTPLAKGMHPFALSHPQNCLLYHQPPCFLHR